MAIFLMNNTHTSNLERIVILVSDEPISYLWDSYERSSTIVILIAREDETHLFEFAASSHGALGDESGE